MKFYIGESLINYCKVHSVEDFSNNFKTIDVCKTLSLPIVSSVVVYNHLRKSLVRNLDTWDELSVMCSSKGDQPKYFSTEEDAYIKLRFYYQEQFWRDELVEVIASRMFNDLGVVEQIPVWTNKGWGCYSKNFATNATFISYASLLNKKGVTSVKVSFDSVKDLIYNETGLDLTHYLLRMVLTDTIVLNEDRHWNNFGVLYTGDSWQIAPLFDYGLGLFEHDEKYDRFKSSNYYIGALNKVRSKPFWSDPFKTIKRLSEMGYRDQLIDMLSKVAWNADTITPSNLAHKHLTSVRKRLESILCLD